MNIFPWMHFRRLFSAFPRLDYWEGVGVMEKCFLFLCCFFLEIMVVYLCEVANRAMSECGTLL